MLALNRVNNTVALSTGNWEEILARDPITNTLHVTFNNIPAGTFVMGSPEGETGRGSDEQQHKVTISKAFYIHTTEVTQGEWKEVMGIQPWKGTSSIKEGPNYAALYVSWDEAVAYCEKLTNKKARGTVYRQQLNGSTLAGQEPIQHGALAMMKPHVAITLGTLKTLGILVSGMLTKLD